MQMKKLATVFLAVIFTFSAFPVYADNLTAIEKVNEIEMVLYGTEQKSALIERVDSLESDINGSTTSDAILTRIDRIYNYVKGNADSTIPSFLTKLNAIEWSFAEKLSEAPAKTRLENMEQLLHGRTDSGPLDDRINVLMAMAFDKGDIEMQRVLMPKDTLVKISIAQALDSKTAREGDPVLFRAEDNIYVGNVLVIPKGALGHGKVVKVSRAKNFGRNARIEIEYTDILSVDNNKVPVLLGKLAKEQTESLALAAGASMAGMIILGPVGVIGGAFIKGKEYSIPEGAVLYVQTREDFMANGMLTPNAPQGDKTPSSASGGL